MSGSALEMKGFPGRRVVVEFSLETAESLYDAALRNGRTMDGLVEFIVEDWLFGAIRRTAHLPFPKVDLAPRQKRVNLPQKLRLKIFERDKKVCRHCLARIGFQHRWHVDHVVPVSKGGTNEEANLQLLCEACNMKKGNR